MTSARLEQRVMALPDRAQLAFSLILCERQMPFLSWFASQTSFGTTLVYRRWLDAAWQALGDRADSREWAAGARACYDGAPDQDDYDHPLAAHALNAALSVGLTMDFLADGDVAHVLEARQLVSDTAGFYEDMFAPRGEQGVLLYHPSKNDRSAAIHPYAQRELERQSEDLEFVAALSPEFTPDSVRAIRDRVWEGPGR